jgi:pyruvate kinase
MLNEVHDLVKRRTKIVATLGPATDDLDVLVDVINAGVNVVRLNFSHGTHKDHLMRIENVREAAKKCKKIVGILADLQGPKIRIAKFKQGEVFLKSGDEFILDAGLGNDDGDEDRVGVDYKELPNDVFANDMLLLDDGRLKMRVIEVCGTVIRCAVLNDAKLSNNKGVNRFGGGLSAKALTQKDIDDLEFAVQHGVDYIAVSFPRDAADIEQAKALVKSCASESDEGYCGIIAKIERAEAVANLEEIIHAADGVMVARGDLAVEIGAAEVPLVQKDIIQMARTLDKPVIVATQMMESMIVDPVPTRAEVSDVAHAVLDNTDAVMLSAETAVGKHPVVTVQTMSRVCLRVEKQPRSQVSKHRVECQFKRIDEAVSMACMYTANHLDVSAILALTESGSTPLWMSRIRTSIPIYGMSRSVRSLGKMCLYRGVYPLYFDIYRCVRDNLNQMAVKCLVDAGYIENGNMVILTKGDLIGVGGGANAMKILKVGEVF